MKRRRSQGVAWRPAATIASLRARAELVGEVRQFFAKRGVWEVETPLLAETTATDPHLDSLSCKYVGPGAESGRRLFLQTSPEPAMKRLLAAGSGSIFQICKAFRNRERGALHQPEFTLLEWYRVDLDHHGLMDEVDELLGELLGLPPGERLSYAEAFRRATGLDPHTSAIDELAQRCQELGFASQPGEPGPGTQESALLEGLRRDAYLAMLMSHSVEPGLGQGRPTLLHDFPASQAALARLSPTAPHLAERFEVYVGGLELGNGFHELRDAEEQRRRFLRDLELRRQSGLHAVPIDESFLAALDHGLPPCAGIALGLDRLAMLRQGSQRIDEVIAFPIG